MKALNIVSALVIISSLTSCVNEKVLSEEIKNKAYISEYSIFADPVLDYKATSDNNKYSELIWFSNHAQDKTIAFAVESPQAFSGAGKLQLAENNKWIFVARKNKNYCNQEMDIRRKSYIESFKFNENKISFKLSHLNDTLNYFKLDSSKPDSMTIKNLYNQKYSIKGDFFLKQNYDSIVIKVQKLKAYKNCVAQFTLWDEKGAEIGNAPFEYRLDTEYPYIALNNSKEMIGIPFWGFITNVKQDQFHTKVLFNDSWEYFHFKKIKNHPEFVE